MTVTPEGEIQLLRILNRRRLNERMIEVFRTITHEKSLKRGQVTTNQSATYDAILDSLKEALRQGWIAPDDVAKILHESELAGRQHVIVYDVPKEIEQALVDSIRAPRTLNNDPLTLDEFLEVPKDAYSRVEEHKDSLVVRVTSPRLFWFEESKEVTDDREHIVRVRRRERASVVIKYDRSRGRLQFRIPVSEQKSSFTGTAVFEFLHDVLGNQFGSPYWKTWFEKLKYWPIGLALPSIVKDRDRFGLLRDTPENNTIKSSLAVVGSSEAESDLRNFLEWAVYEEGYSRAMVRGICRGEDYSVGVHLHADKIKWPKGSKTTSSFARIFFPNPQSDREVENVLCWIGEHFPSGC